jgi:hypothetical protein
MYRSMLVNVSYQYNNSECTWMSIVIAAFVVFFFSDIEQCFTNVQVSAHSVGGAREYIHIYHSSLSSNKFTCLLLLIHEFSFWSFRFVFIFYLHFPTSRMICIMYWNFFVFTCTTRAYTCNIGIYMIDDVYIYASPSLISIVGITSFVLIVTSLTCIYIVTKAG